jgi:regulator of sirC expression with transglutaminase-like and TPR domain
MTLPLKLSPLTPLRYFETLVIDPERIPLLEAAASLAQDEDLASDPGAVLSEVDRLVSLLKRRIPADASALHRLRRLNHFFFVDQGYGGNSNDYYNPANSYLHEVIRTRLGIPISLGVLYLELALQMGLQAQGVSFPGHFLVKVHTSQGEVVIDPCTGRSLSREDLEERLLPYKLQRGLQGEFEVPLGLFLQASSARDILARMLRNLKEIHRADEDWDRMLKVTERLVVLLPEDGEECRDRGLTLAELGRWHEAARDVERYLEMCPAAADSLALAERLEELRRLARAG